MPIPRLTEPELIGVLEKTYLPTILVEGEADAAIYRWVERSLGIFTASVMVCSGRDTLLRLYQQRERFRGKPLVWLADLDMWKFSAPPTEYAGVIFTAGYSIENDLYAGAVIEDLLEPAERVKFTDLLAVVCRWFAFEVEEYRGGREHQAATSIYRVIDFTNLEVSPSFMADRGYRNPDTATVSEILDDYKLKLRGKTLLQAIVKFLSHSDRREKYSVLLLVDICLRLYSDNQYLNRILQDIRRQLLPQPVG